MSFSFLEPHLTRQVATANFAEARLRHAVFVPYSSAASVVQFLRMVEELDPIAKAELTAAFIVEAQRPGPAFAAALVQAYQPMLANLSRRNEHLVEEESIRESMLLEAFLEAIASCSLSEREAKPSLYLHRETKRRFLLAARRHWRVQETFVAVDELAEGDVPWAGELNGDASREEGRFRRAVAEEADELGALLRDRVGSRLTLARLQLVESTVLRREELAAYASRTAPHQSEAESRRTYLRLQRQRHRTLQMLRKLLAPWRDEVAAGGAQ